MRLHVVLLLCLAATVARASETDPGPVRPEAFGAAGDGRRDDTRALQAALDAAEGRPVLLGEHKIYLVNAPLRLPARTTLRGAGATSVLHFTWRERVPPEPGGRQRPAYLWNAHQKGGDHDIALEDFALEGGSDGMPSGPNAENPRGLVPGIRVSQVNRLSIRRLEVRKTAGIAVLYLGCTHVVIEDNWVHDSGRDGITGMWSERNLSDVVVRRNKIERAGDDGIAIWGDVPGVDNPEGVRPSNILIADNLIRGWPKNPNGLLLGRGIAVGSAQDVRIERNRIDFTVGSGILVRQALKPMPGTGRRALSARIRIAGNTIQHAGQDYNGSTIDFLSRHPHDGIDIQGATQVTVAGNRIEDSFGQAIVARGCRDCSLP